MKVLDSTESLEARGLVTITHHELLVLNTFLKCAEEETAKGNPTGAIAQLGLARKLVADWRKECAREYEIAGAFDEVDVEDAESLLVAQEDESDQPE